MTFNAPCWTGLLAVRDVGIDFDVPEISRLGLPVAAVLSVGSVVAWARGARGGGRARSSRGAGLVVAGMALLLFAAVAGPPAIRRHLLAVVLGLGVLGWSVAGYRRTTSSVNAGVRAVL